MDAVAKLKYLRIAPRKVRLVADLIRGKKVGIAQNILSFTKKGSSEVLLKLLNQAISNAKNNLKLEEENLYISKILVNEGPKIKRFRPRARGSAYEIQKKTSHIILTLSEFGKTQKAKKSEKLEVKRASEPEAASAEKLEKDEKPQKEEKFTPEKPRFKAEKEIKKSEGGKVLRKIFRRQTF